MIVENQSDGIEPVNNFKDTDEIKPQKGSYGNYVDENGKRLSEVGFEPTPSIEDQNSDKPT